MQILLNYLKIMKIFYFVKFSKGSYLNLKYILQKLSKKLIIFKKTIIFINTIHNI